MTTLEKHINGMFKTEAKKIKTLQGEAKAALEQSIAEADKDIRLIVDLRSAMYRGKDMTNVSMYLSGVTIANTTLCSIAKRHGLSGEPVRILGQEKRVKPNLPYLIAEFEHTSMNLITIIRDRRKAARAALKKAEK